MGTPKQPATHISINQLLAWIFAILFVISTIGVIFSFFPSRRLLNPDLYKQALEDVRIYQRLPESIARQLAANLTQVDEATNSTENSGVYLLLLDQSEWESILIGLINLDWLQSQTENVIDQFFTILLKSPDPINSPIEVSLLEVKNRLAGPEGVQAFNQILEAQIPCSIEQLMGLLQMGLGMETSIESLLCRPPDYVLTELDPLVESLLIAATAQVPDQITFHLPLSLLESSTSGITREIKSGLIPAPIRYLRLINTFVSWSLLLPIALIILVTAFAVRSLKELLLWWGGTFITAGLISLVLSLALFPIANCGFSKFIPTEINGNFDLSAILLQIGLGDLSRYLANELIMSIVVPASFLTFIGFALLLGFYLHSKSTSPNNMKFK